jgi:L-ascorbate metabolism protein UlaG (beta-lactamase superfamily)
MIDVNGSKILIDALFKIRPPNKAKIDMLAEAESKKIIEGISPYDNVNLFLITHAHEDHFNPGMILEYLKHNDSVVVMASRQVIEKIKEANRDSVKLKDRVINIDLKMNEGSFEKQFPGFSVTSWWINHDGPTNYAVVNIVYLIKIGGKTILHLADADPIAEVYKKFAFKERNIDYLFLPFWHVYDSAAVVTTNHFIAAKNIIPMHILPFDNANVEEDIRKAFPEAIILNARKRDFLFVQK